MNPSRRFAALASLLFIALALPAGAQQDDLTANHPGFRVEWLARTNSVITDVALADVDADGAPDLFVIDGSTLELWRNNGRGEFMPDPDPVCPIPLNTLLAFDADGDSRADVIGAASGGGLVYLKGLGNGAFDNPRILSVGVAFQRIAAIDLEGDGFFELACSGPSEGGLQIIPGPGSSAASRSLLPGMSVGAMTAVDLDEDGRGDLVVSTEDRDARSIIVLLNRAGALAFTAELDREFQRTDRLLPLDFDGDGHLDLFVSYEEGPFRFDVLLGDGTGQHWRTRHIEHFYGSSISGVAAQAHSGGDTELLISWKDGYGALLGVYAPRRDPTLSNPILISYTHSGSYPLEPPNRLISSDLNHDELADVLLVTASGPYGYGPGMIGVLLDDNGAPAGIRIEHIDIPAQQIAAARIHPSRPPCFVLAGDSGSFLTSVQDDGSLAPSHERWAGRTVHAVDLTHDGRDDLILGLRDGTTEIRIMRPQGPGPVAARFDGRLVTTGDLDNDGRPELLLRPADGFLQIVWGDDKRFRRISKTGLFLDDYYFSRTLLTIGDSDGDGRNDLIECRLHTPIHYKELTFDSVATYGWKNDSLELMERVVIWNVIPGQYSPAWEVRAANLDGNSGDEVVVLTGPDGKGGGGAFTVLGATGNGAYTFLSRSQVSGEYPRALSLADLDGDGDLDAACVSNPWASYGVVNVRWNDGSGNLTGRWGRRIASSQALHMAVADFDEDGAADIAILARQVPVDPSYPPGSIAFLYGRRDIVSARVPQVEFSTVPESDPTVGIRDLSPNPARGEFTIRWSVPASGPATIDLLDVAGRRVRGAPVDSRGARDGEARFDGLERLPAGLYWVRLRQGDLSVTKRVALIR